MKAVKIAAIILGVLLLLIAGIVAYVSATFDSARLKTEAAKVVLEKTQRHLKIDGDVALSFWPNVGVRVGKTSLSEHGSDKQFAAINDARVSVALLPLLSKQIEVNTIELDGVRATIIKRRDGSLNIDDLLSKGEEKSAKKDEEKGDEGGGSTPTHIDIAGIKITNAQLTWRDEQSGQTSTVSGLDFATGHVVADTGKQTYLVEGLKLGAKGKTGGDNFEVDLAAPKLAYAPDSAGGERVTLTAKLSGKHSATATLTASDISGSAEAVKIGKLELDADAKQDKAAVALKLNTAVDAQIGKQIVALDKIGGQLEITDPRMPMKSVKLPLSGRLHANLAKPSADGALSTQFDESKIALKFDVPKFKPLSVGFDLAIDQLNVDKYLPPSKPGAKTQGGQAGKPGEESKIDLSALKGLNLNGQVRIGKLQVANVKATNVKLDVRAAGGKLDIAPHSMNLYQGSLTGALSVNANGNVVAAREKLTGVDINPLLKDLADKDLIEGHGNVQLDVTTRGATVSAMKKALAGKASVALKDGALKGINLAQTFREVKAKFSSHQDAVQQAKSTDKTDFTSLTASFRIANGIAHNDDLLAKSPFLRLSGAGDINIGNSSINYLAKASVVETSGGQGGKDLAQLKGVTVPVRVTGPFDRMTYKLELASLAREAVKAKVEEKRQEIEQRAKEKLLKGLFK
jgi:AsmA protein